MDEKDPYALWRLGVAKDKRLLFIECPPLSHNGNKLIFERMGFEIKLIQTFCENLEQLLLVEDKFQPEEFDMVIVCVGLEVSSDIVISEPSIKSFKKKLQQNSGKSIPVVGMNLYLSGEKLKAQRDVFKGLFIGQDLSDIEIISMCRDVIIRNLD